MAAGGARPGAGRPKGAANKLNDQARAQALEGGISPLDYLLGVLRDDEIDRETRMDAAKAAAPYVHAKLTSVDANHSGKIDSHTTFKMEWMTEAEAKRRGWA